MVYFGGPHEMYYILANLILPVWLQQGNLDKKNWVSFEFVYNWIVAQFYNVMHYVQNQKEVEYDRIRQKLSKCTSLPWYSLFAISRVKCIFSSECLSHNKS